jgi:iron(III) transport system ATP-binding protein
LPAIAANGAALSLRPHALAVAVHRDLDANRLWFDGTICESEFLGEFTRYEVRVGANLLTADAPHLSTTTIYAPGSRVQVGIDPSELRILP